MFFWHGEAPAQRAVGDCPPLKELPEEGTRRRRFFKIIKKINLVSLRGELKLNVEREIRVLSVQPNVIPGDLEHNVYLINQVFITHL